MGKSQVPRGCKEKIKCSKCGRLCWPYLIVNRVKTTCSICVPIVDKKK